MEASCHIFMICLVYRFFRFDILSISFDIPGISFLKLLSLSEKTGIMITKCVIPGILHKKPSLQKKKF